MWVLCAVTDGAEEPNLECHGGPSPSQQVASIQSICSCPIHLAAEIHQTCIEGEQRHPPEHPPEEYLLNPNEPHQSIDELSPALFDPPSHSDVPLSGLIIG